MRSLMVAACLVFLSASGCAWMKGAPTNTPPAGAQAAPPAASGSPTTQAPPPASSPSQPVSSVGDQPTKEAAAAAAAPRAPVVPAQPSNNPAAAPTLNLTDLEQRLRDTHAIGVFTKLSLKNQVDDLLSEFRKLYKSPDKRPSSELRQRYDLLLLKVTSLLQDSDPSCKRSSS
jgi:hypothetical protein